MVLPTISSRNYEDSTALIGFPDANHALDYLHTTRNSFADTMSKLDRCSFKPASEVDYLLMGRRGCYSRSEKRAGGTLGFL
jgi:hypothetical protein